MKKLGVQLYNVRKEFGIDPRQTLRDLKAIGFTSFEAALIFGGNTPKGAAAIEKAEIKFGFKLPKSILTAETAPAIVDYCRNIGLDVVSGHLFLVHAYQGFLNDVLSEVIAFAKKTGISNFVVSYMLDSKAVCDLFAGDINAAVLEMAKHNLTLCYHNHDMEMKKVDGEQTVLEYLMGICDDRLKLQLDIGWCYAGGGDVLKFIETYGNKIAMLHLKDFKSAPEAGQKWDSFCAIGEGIVPTEQALRLSKNLGIIDNGIIIDQDDAMTTMMEELETGYKNVSRYQTNV